MRKKFRGVIIPQKIKKFLIMSKIVILLLGLSLQVQASVYSQENKLTLKLDNASAKEVFYEIERISDFTFVYQFIDIKSIDKISLNVKNEVVEKILDKCFKDTEIGYLVIDKHIIIKKKKNLPSSQKTEIIKGKITDKKGNPLPGVSVVIKGTNTGVASDVNGKFEIKAEKGDILEISFIGMKSRTIKITSNKFLTIVLEPTTEELEEVVITGYQRISRERVTGSFDKINTSQIVKPAASISERLVGSVPGMRISSNGKFEIRGKTSLTANDNPLIVIDGFPVQNGLNSVNPEDIESVTVLKDAAAASIWGARSANGVIVITTKQAKKNGKTNISVSSFIKIADRIDLDYANPIASSREVVELEQRAFNTSFYNALTPSPLVDNYKSVLKKYSSAMVLLNEKELGHITEAERDAGLAKLKNLNNKGQIEDYLLRKALLSQYNINISGSSERMQNRVSVMFQNNKDKFVGNDYKNVMLNYKTKVNITEWMDFNLSTMVQYKESHNNGTSLSNIKSLSPYDMLIGTNGEYLPVNGVAGLYYNKMMERHIPIDKFIVQDYYRNPVQDLRNKDYKTTNLNTRIQAGITLKLAKGISIDSRLQYEIYNAKNKNYLKEEHSKVRSELIKTSTWDRNANTVVANLPAGGFLDMNRAKVTTLNIRNQLNINKSWKDHAVNAIVGVETSETLTTRDYSPRTYGYNDDKLTLSPFPNGPGSNVYSKKLKDWMGSKMGAFGYTNSYNWRKDRYYSLYGNVAYTFKDKYSISGSARTDASNFITDDPKYRYAPFWSIGGKWQISKEEFLNSFDWINRLSVRVTYGFNGNVDNNTAFKPLLSIKQEPNGITGEYTGSVSSYGNPTLRWEKTGAFDFGIDYAILDNRLYGKIDIYSKKSKDLLINMSLPMAQGTNSQRLNEGEMINKGIELQVGTNLNLYGNDITWNGILNFAYNKNEITDYFQSRYAYDELTASAKYIEGYNANSLWSFKYSGLKQFGDKTIPAYYFGKDEEGNDKFQPVTVMPTSTDGRDISFHEGTTVAPYILGFNNSFKIYDFDFSFIIIGEFGHKFRMSGFNYPTGSGGYALPNKFYSEVSKSDGSNLMPLPTDEQIENGCGYTDWNKYAGRYFDYFIGDASSIRFREINVTYNMPKNLLNKIGVKNLQVYTQINNIGTILFNSNNEDPMYKYGNIKPTTTYTLGFKLNL